MSGRPLNVGDVVLAAFKICGDRWKDLLKVTAMTVLPAAIFGSLLIASFMPDVLLKALGNSVPTEVTDEALRAIPTSDWVNLGIAAAVYVVISTIANAVALTAAIFISLDHHEDRSRPHNEVLRAAFSRLRSMLWLITISGLLMVLGFLACVIPGVWLYVSWSVAPVVLLHEGLKSTKAMKRSRGLVKPSFWLAFVVLLLELACIFVLQAVTGSFPALLLPGAAGNNSFAIFFTLSLGGALAGLFGIALHGAISTELYFALRDRDSA
jgi:hypothetical protein